MKTDLDLNLPFSEAPPHLPPVLDNNAYLEFIEFNLRAAAANNTVEGMIAARPSSLSGLGNGIQGIPVDGIRREERLSGGA